MEVNDVDRKETILCKDGSKIILMLPNFYTERDFALRCRDHAVSMASAYANNPFVFKAMVQAVVDGFASRKYDWSGDVVREARGQEEGFKDLMMLVLNQKDNPQDRAITEEVFDKLIWPDNREKFFEAWHRLNSPTPPTPPAAKA